MSDRVLSNSAVMAAGTIVSKFSGFLRGILLVAALGNLLHADIFNIANTVPTMLYILLAGGVFNAVLVPQLVRAQKNDADGGVAYTSRIMTLGLLFLGVVTVVLVVAAPMVMRIFLHPSFYTPELASQLDSVIAFARYCLPQVFFYGMFVLVGQVLNARGHFGPMMWAPIANNVISVAVLIAYLIVFGGVSHADRNAGFSNGQEALLGLGSTLGVAVQLAVLVPYLRKAGFNFSPRFDFRGTGLGQTFRLGMWTMLFVLVNQIAYTVVVRLASGGTAASALDSGASDATGYTVYSQSFLLVMVPHSIITVSLATAILPSLTRLANNGDGRSLGRELAGTMRTTYAVLLPLLAVIPVLAHDLARVLYSFGGGESTYTNYVPTLSLFALAMVFFTTHYLMLRGFYALERNRQVFVIQCFVAATNIVVALWLLHDAADSQTSPRLVIAYTAAYFVGTALSTALLSRALGGLEGGRTLRFLARLAIGVAIACAVTWAVRHAWLTWLPTELVDTRAATFVRLAVLGLVQIGVFLASARVLRITEVSEVTGVLKRRLR